MDLKQHWQTVYHDKSINSVSWFCEHDAPSLKMLDALSLRASDPILDVGGGASTFVDDLLWRGFLDVTVLDISEASLAAVQARLGQASDAVKWVVGNILEVDLPPKEYRLWRDRAVFHFLIDARDRKRYVQRLKESMAEGGHIIMATFATDGPSQCSNLPVARYDEAGLQAELGKDFVLMETHRVLHKTPAGKDQSFIYCHFQYMGDSLSAEGTA